MKAGFYDAIFTPPAGSVRAGDYFPAYFKGIAGQLKARAAVFIEGDSTYALACVDCCTLGREVIDRTLEYLAGIGGPRLDAYVISASHTHSGTALSTFVQADLVPLMDEKARKLVEMGVVPDPLCAEWAARQLATAIFMAWQKAEPASISTGRGKEEGFIFNRRFFCRDGRTYTHPGRMNPDICGPAGPTDPMVGVIGAWREDGSLIGAVVNYSCHGTLYSGLLVHGDWPSFVEDTIRRQFGEETGVLVLNGPCGDVTQVDNLSQARAFGLDIARRLGVRVGAEAIKVLAGAEKQPSPTMACGARTLKIRHRVPSPSSLYAAWATIEASGEKQSSAEAIFARERIIAGELARLQPEREVPLAAIQLGDALLLSTPAEFFTSLSLRIKEASPFGNTFIVELANGCVGYVPDKAAFDPESGGGYETALTAYSNLVPEAGDMIADNLIAMSREFIPDKVPEDRSVPPGTYWNYGALGPDLD